MAVRTVLLVAAGSVAILVVGAAAVDEGEVVTLTTMNGRGASYDTQLWVVDVDTALYVRSGSRETGWLVRLQAHPEVVLNRGGEAQILQAHPIEKPELKARVNRAMAAKYGAADRFWSWLFDREGSIPVRLDPETGLDSVQIGGSSTNADLADPGTLARSPSHDP